MKILSTQLTRSTAARLFHTRAVVSRPLVVGSSSFAVHHFGCTTSLSSQGLQQHPRRVYFSSDSHDDFAPRKKSISGEDEALELIKQHVKENRIMLYMKGSPQLPMCGFSAKVIKALQAEGVDFASVNVLDYPAIREGVKKFSDWPTIPQLYVDGEFVGGCDIVTSMHESGELKELLKGN